MNKKAQELPIQTIVILAIAVLVAVVVVIFFVTSQAQSATGLGQFQQGATGDTNLAGRTAACNIACVTYNFVDTTGDGTCDNSDVFCANNRCPLGFTCPTSCSFTCPEPAE
ncbi:MAG: hypothetical protein PHW96_02075 [Candidatus Nanoarchaeia archaeon]|nr:hypothetical protein [Candidatus Nanoarchaeia archaeon]